MLLEEIIGLLYQISSILLKTHKENPGIIGVLDLNFILKVNEFVNKEREIMALTENMELF